MTENQQRILKAIQDQHTIQAMNQQGFFDSGHLFGTLLVSNETDSVYLNCALGSYGGVQRSIPVELNGEGLPYINRADFDYLRPVSVPSVEVEALVKSGKVDLYHFDFKDYYRMMPHRSLRFQQSVEAIGGIWVREITHNTVGMQRERFCTRFGYFTYENQIKVMLQGFRDDGGQQEAFFTSALVKGTIDRPYIVVNMTGQPHPDVKVRQQPSHGIHILTDHLMLEHPDIDSDTVRAQLGDEFIRFFCAPEGWYAKKFPV